MKTAIYKQTFAQCYDLIRQRRELCQRLKIAQTDNDTYMIDAFQESIEHVDYALSLAITAKYMASRMIVAYNGHNSFWELVTKYCDVDISQKRGKTVKKLPIYKQVFNANFDLVQEYRALLDNGQYNSTRTVEIEHILSSELWEAYPSLYPNPKDENLFWKVVIDRKQNKF